ncbi:MAG: S-adenosylmethionine:tRNA ribosyltransferase-isomerase, partial [Cyanobacteria bacterium J06649_4]
MADDTAMDQRMNAQDLALSAYSYDLPASRIAQHPVTPRDRSKLLVIDSPTTHQHSHFYELADWLKPGDLLVVNNTKVIPARLLGHKSSGAAVEVLLVEPMDDERWLALVRPGKRIQPGVEIIFGPLDKPLLKALVESKDAPTGGRVVRLVPQ